MGKDQNGRGLFKTSYVEGDLKGKWVYGSQIFAL